MSLDGVIAGLQIHGIGAEIVNINTLKIGFVIPTDLNVITKNNNLFSTYSNKYVELNHFLEELERNYDVQIQNMPSISQNVDLWDGIPASGAWACYQVTFNESVNIADLTTNFIPAKFN